MAPRNDLPLFSAFEVPPQLYLAMVFYLDCFILRRVRRHDKLQRARCQREGSRRARCQREGPDKERLCLKQLRKTLRTWKGNGKSCPTCPTDLPTN